jgi:hypothetical protein
MRGVVSVPASPEAVASFAASQAEQGLKPSTISRSLAAIRMLHRASGVETPTSSEIVTATRRGGISHHIGLSAHLPVLLVIGHREDPA